MIEVDHLSVQDKKIGFWTSTGLAIYEFLKGWIEHNHGLQTIAYEAFDACLKIAIGGFLAATIAYHTRKFWSKKDKINIE